MTQSFLNFVAIGLQSVYLAKVGELFGLFW